MMQFMETMVKGADGALTMGEAYMAPMPSYAHMAHVGHYGGHYGCRPQVTYECNDVKIKEGQGVGAVAATFIGIGGVALGVLALKALFGDCGGDCNDGCGCG